MTKRNVGKMDLSGGDGNLSNEEAAAEIYGDSPATGLDMGRVVAKPTRIHEIWPDLRQPRRVIPLVVRGQWNGDPDELGEVLKTWQSFAEKDCNRKLDVVKAIKGYEAIAEEDGGPMYKGFASLVKLAAAIYAEGLTNPITIIQNGSQWQVETGERRWLAHHLLALHINPQQYGKIAAREVKYDPFRQASENNSREGYNAIEMARQIAILIMESRAGIDGVKYDRFEDMVLAGECDRKFYAQVANGYIHKIPDGLGGKIVNATGLSIARISQYRALLKLTDDEELNDSIWLEADTNAWTEHYIRETLLPSLKPKPESSTAVEHQDGERLTAVNHSEEELEPDNPSSAAENDSTTPFAGSKYQQILPPENPTTRSFTPPRLDSFGRTIPPAQASAFGSPTRVDGEIDSPPMNLKGKKVRLKDGREGTIWEDKGGEKLMFLKTGATISNEVYRSAIWTVLGDETTQVNSNPPQASSTGVTSRPQTNGKLAEDKRLHTMLGQARYLMATLGDKAAEDSLNMLDNITMAEIRAFGSDKDQDTIRDYLQGQYNIIAAGMQSFLHEVDGILQNWALMDEAERRGE